MIINAGIPSKWTSNESGIWPWSIKETELPNPQPGQYSIPALAIGQIVKCDWLGSFINARNINEHAHTIPSKPNSLYTNKSLVEINSENELMFDK